GIVLYQALTLRKPFPADTLTTLVYQILHEEPLDTGLVTNDLPDGLRDVIRKCLAKDRANRYADARELAEDLREILGFSPVGSTAAFSDSKVKRARSSSGAPPPVAPPEAPPMPASMAPTAALKVGLPVGRQPEVAGFASAPTVPSMPAVAAPASDSESPTITTGRRMGEVLAKAAAAAHAPKKKGVSAFVLAGGLLAAAAIVLGVLSLLRGSEKEGGARVLPTAAPAAFAPAQPPPASVPASASVSSAAGPSVAVVETPAPEISPAAVPAKKGRAKPTGALEAPAPGMAASKPVNPSQKPADLRVTIRRFLKLDISPSQARVYLDGRYIGISDDWDDSGGGSLLAFNLEGTHRLRLCAPQYRDLNVELIVRSTATDDKVTIERSLEKGTPNGPTGPEGKLKHPSYRTVRAAVFNVEPPGALVTVNGRELGPASKWAKEDLQFADMAVYDVLLSAPGYESKSFRILVGPTAGEVRANVKEKLKRM
ncbi:MAG: hypothetical protein ACXVH0_02275, partial [Thermoanaerobaculia bacterium]